MKFDARVIGIPTHLESVKKTLEKSDWQMEAAKFAAAEKKLLSKLVPQKRAITDFFHKKAPCAAHFRCERTNLLQPLLEYACFVDGTSVEEVVQENAWTASLHTVMLGVNDSLIVPFDFAVPYECEVEGRAHKYVVASAPHLLKELTVINEYVAVEKTLGAESFGLFVNWSKQAMERFERSEGVGRRFWAKMALVALRGVVQQAVEQGLPVIIDPQLGSLDPVMA
jgi:hypothetical protein